VLLDALEHEEQLSLDLVWEEIGEEGVARGAARRRRAPARGRSASRRRSRGRVAHGLIERFASVRAFVPLLRQTIEFGATAEAAGILDAMTDLPGLLDARATTAVPAGYLDARRIADDVVPAGWWQRLVFRRGPGATEPR
jgi:hypothetical protein